MLYGGRPRWGIGPAPSPLGCLLVNGANTSGPGGDTGYYGAESEERLKPLRWTSHALEALVDRDVDRAEVERTIAAPELSIVDPPRRAVLMRRYFDVRLGSQMLLRVVVEEAPDERVVVTVYKTSKIAKYLKGTVP